MPPELRGLCIYGNTMLFGTVSALLALVSGWLWWKLDRAQDENTVLFAEITRLRARLRLARQ